MRLKEQIDKAINAIENNSKVYNISFVCMYSVEDEHLLEGLKNTLPNGAEWILFKCVQDENIKKDEFVTEVFSEVKGRLISGILYVHPDTFRFDHCKNIIKNFSTNEWVFSIDADERLQIDQHKFIEDATKLNKDVIGVKIYDPSGFNAFIVTRLFKKKYNWIGACHEQLTDGEKIITVNDCVITNLLIRHDGYHIDKNRDERNLKLLLKEENRLHPYWYEKIIETAYNLKIKRS